MSRFIFIITMLFFTQAKAQKVGLVFSGGGAKGFAHVGVLKALEENNIPIDYIVGTSMGGIVGAMYAAGYTPAEIEKVALSEDLQNWVNGRVVSDYNYYFQKKPLNPSILTLKLQLDTGFRAQIRSNLVSDTPLNFAFMELLTQASAASDENFDKLFVPFRCVVADIVSHKASPISQGSLADAVRGTCAVPLIFRPVKINGKYVFDGGIYNNFPVDVLKKDFNPDYIIGSNVSSKTFNEYPKDDDKLMNQFLLYMFLANSDSTNLGPNGVYIQPELSEYTAIHFSDVAMLIKRGYEATLANMPNIKKLIQDRVDSSELARRRAVFNDKKVKLTINTVAAHGGWAGQRKYIERFFRKGKDVHSFADIKKLYARLIADDNFETVYPMLKYRPEKKAYDFDLQIQPHRTFKADIGAVVSTRPVNNTYIGLQYNFLDKQAYTMNANFYLGRFYESVQGAFRMDVPTRLPYYLEVEYIYNSWDYFNNSKIFTDNADPTFIDQSDQKIVLKAGLPIPSNAKLEMQVGYADLSAQYSPIQSYNVGYQLDDSRYRGLVTGIRLQKQTLNRPQYANKGFNFQLNFNYYTGTEEYKHGDILKADPAFLQIVDEQETRTWRTIKLSTEQYVFSSKAYSLGYVLEGVWSDKPFFSTYQSTLISAPAFYPLQDSKSVFLEKFRANSYGAFGVKNVFGIYRNLDCRLEAYVFQPLKPFQLEGLQSTQFGESFSTRHCAATLGLVYRTIVGPVSLSLNHYDDDKRRYGVMFHVGFLLYNKRSFE